MRRSILPQQSFLFPGQRWVNITLRALHLIGVVGMGGGYLFGLPASQWLAYGWLTLLSGGLLSLLYLFTDAGWLAQLKGQAILLKLLLLAAALLLPALQSAVFIAVIVLSALIAHAPGWFRGYRPLEPSSRRTD